MASELPTGTVTFLFTDVEGSTKLLDELGPERYAEALGAHRAVVRAALGTHDGVEVDTQGDAFFCAFASARSAVACAQDVLDGLASGRIRLRMGIHSGEALVADGHYLGMDVHRAARIGACGHGGQVVLSPSTVALLEPGSFELADLGEHRLKDLSAPVRLHQLGGAAFPPLKTLFRTNLPVPATAFLGRDEELRDLVERASAPGVRLVTLTGPGGTGKTRLSLQVAAELAGEFPDGVWWVPLASLRDGAHVASAVASALDVDEEPGRPLADSIAAGLGDRRSLLLLDNCEHVVDDVASLVAAVVGGCQDVLVLATSREPLDISGEQVVAVQPLVSTDAVELFFARAAAAGAQLDRDGTNEVVAALCARLDNLPLAVELAAARAAALPPAALLDRLSTGLDVLKGPRDVEERQRTLRATIAWSYSLLDEHEQRLFRRLSVFPGGASLEAAEGVCDADLEDLLSLVAKSLVRQTPVEDGEPRYWMLETIREFAVSELDASGEQHVLQRRHAELFVDMAREFRGAAELNASDWREWLDRSERELPNLRAAFEFASENERSDDVVVLAMALWIAHQARGRYSEAAEAVRQALGFASDPLDVSWLQEALGRVLRIQGHPKEALEVFEASERILETIGDRDAYWWWRWVELEMTKATFFYFENRQEELASLVRQIDGWVHEHGTPMQRLEFLHLRTQQAYRREKYAPSAETETLARETFRRAVELDDPSADFMLGFCLLWRGELEEAEEHFAAGLEVTRSAGLVLLWTRCLVYGTIVRRRRNDLEGVREWLGELEAQDELHGYRGLTAANVAWVAYRDGDHERVLARGQEALEDWNSEGRSGSRVFEWTARFPMLGVELERGQVEEALEHARAMLDESQQPLPAELAEALADAVEASSVEGLAGALGLARELGYA